jgi:hypothetical protein
LVSGKVIVVPVVEILVLPLTSHTLTDHIVPEGRPTSLKANE